MPIVIQVTPASAAGLEVALQPPVAASEIVLEATGTTAGWASRFPTGAPGSRPCCATIKDEEEMKVSAGCLARASQSPRALL